jgi:hypothetical protein
MIAGNNDTALECKFQACCKYYRKDLDTCHDDAESTSHCAARWQFEEFDKGNQIGTNVANLLIVKISNLEKRSEIIIA